MTPAQLIEAGLAQIQRGVETAKAVGADPQALAPTLDALDELRGKVLELANDIYNAEANHCPSCEYGRKSNDREPYGDGHALRPSIECGADNAFQCPIVIACGFRDPSDPAADLPQWLQREAG